MFHKSERRGALGLEALALPLIEVDPLLEVEAFRIYIYIYIYIMMEVHVRVHDLAICFAL